MHKIGGKITKKLKFLLLVICITLFLSCRKDSPTDANGVNNIHPQADISWPSLADSPWPSARGNMQCDARSHYKGPQQGTVAWIFTENGLRIETSAPVIGEDGSIYFTVEFDFREYRLYAVKPDGTLKWKVKVPRNTSSTPIIGKDDIIYLSTEGAYYAFNSDGSIKWEYITNTGIYNFSEAIGLDGTIYFADFTGTLYALNPDGCLKWKTSGFGGLHSLRLFNSIAMSPDGSSLYVVGSDTTLNAIDSQNGSLLWKLDMEGNIFFNAPMVDSDGNVYYISKDTIENEVYSPIVSVDSQGKLRWKSKISALSGSHLHIDKFGNIYFKSGYLLSSIDYSGNLRWSKDVRIGDLFLSYYPIIGDNEGTIYVALNNSYILSIDHHGNEKFVCEIPDTWTGLAMGALSKDGFLYVCGKYKLICIK